jgi:two-component system sensor histidine kinase AtoS
MRVTPDIFFIFLLSTLLLLLLFALIFLIPRLIKKRELEQRDLDRNNFFEALQSFSKEIKSLKEQLVLKERLAALGEVSAGIAHEIRNPLGVIAGYARLILKSLDERDIQKRELVMGILKEVDEINSVMEELLKFSRSEPISKKELNLTKMIKDIVETLENKDRVIYQIEDPLFVRADEELLKKALKNIIKNGIDEAEKVWIDITKEKLEGHEGTVITIKDNGKGILEEDRDKIFMPFYTTKEKGTGIGLALAQKIVTAHEGKIAVESKVGEGSVFKIFLPQ